jgi:hypothetical protein
MCPSRADPGCQVRGGALKKIAPSGGRREHFWDISCEKLRQKILFFPILGGARQVRPYGVDDCLFCCFGHYIVSLITTYDHHFGIFELFVNRLDSIQLACTFFAS